MNDPFLPEELRLFIACTLPEDWLAALSDASHDLARAGLGQLRWVRPEGIHLTLKFLGDAGRHLLPDLESAISEACRGQAPFELVLEGLGSFASRRSPRVLWAGVGGEVAKLTALQTRVDVEVSRLGFAREVRPFSPHLTLARVPESAAADTGARMAALLKTTRLREVAAFHVSEASLVRSQLGPGGARYTALATVPLQP